MQKRGQAAAFIIIGIVVLAVIFSVIAVRQGFLNNLFASISSERTTVPEQVKPLQTFLDSCVSAITKDAITTVGLQGGYINLKSDEVPTTSFSPLDRNLEIIPDSDLKTAVWFRERGNGIQELNIPTREDMQNEIANYVSSNFGQCVYNLSDFEQKGFLIDAKGVPKTDVQIGNGKISSVVNFPINVKIADTNFSLIQHRADFDSNLGKLYTMGKEIMQKQNEDYFLENKTIDMLVAYDSEVPFSGTDLSCNQKIWEKSDVERKLKNILYENIAAVRVKGSNYQSNDKLKYLEFDGLQTKDNKVSVNLMYIPNWPTEIEITPSEGNLLMSDQIAKKVGGPISTIMSSFFCLNQHRFVYTIKYPVLITLTDDNGLTFQYATQVLIKNNEPRENREVLNLPDVNEQICKYPQKDVTIFTGAINPAGDLVPLNNVSLNFKCFPASCPLGSSNLNPNGEPVLTAKVPLCFNGLIEGYKEGFKQVQKTEFSSNQNDSSTALVQLEPVYTKKVNIFVIEKETGKVRTPYDTEQINFQFSNNETNYQSTYIYPNKDSSINLIAGSYNIDSYILRNSSTYKITLPKKTIQNCVDTQESGLLGFFKTQQVCSSVDTEPMEFDTVLTGGATKFTHTFDREELANDAPLNLYVLASNIPSNSDDLQRIQIGLETNKESPLFREPTIE